MTELIIILLPLIAQIESNNNNNAVGDDGKAIGIYQIHKIYVDDVNRILGEEVFTYEDRKDIQRSRLIVAIYLNHYGKQYYYKHNKWPTMDILARIHNGGPKGYTKAATLHYWTKIKRVYKNEE